MTRARQLVLLAGLSLHVAGVASAQVPSDSLTPRRPGAGISVMLPSTWRPLGDSLREQVRRVVDTAMSRTTDSTLRESLKLGRPIMLLQEMAPGIPDLNVSLNVAASPGARRTTFDGVSDAAMGEALAQLCPSVRAMVEQMGGRVITCDRAVPDQAAGHAIAVSHFVRSGPFGFVAVWLAQVPDQDLVYTLTLSAPHADAERFRPLFQRIWRSMSLGEP